jgi:hypothetical protein
VIFARRKANRRQKQSAEERPKKLSGGRERGDQEGGRVEENNKELPGKL